jgi:uncharacterized repeat protein (TIGR01451 family)
VELGVAGVAVDGSGNLYIAGGGVVSKVSAAGIITTVAGNGSLGYSGDGGPATSAGLDRPSGVAVDASGNLYIADDFNERIRKVSTAGIITTVAGNGSYGYSGDGGPATSAQLLNPQGVAVDASGNLYIADTYDNRVRKVSAAGIITTVAGAGPYGYSGDGGPATSAQLYLPYAVAVDASGDVYIADSHNDRIRKVSAAGIITTAAGNGSCCYAGDGGPATSAQLWSPSGVAVDTSGDLYIADAGNNRVRKISAAGVIRTVAGNGTCPNAGFAVECYSGDGGAATSAQFSDPSGVAVDASGDLYITDTYNNRVRRVSAAGTITTVAGNGSYGYSGDGGPATSAQLGFPSGVAVDAGGNLYIADAGSGRVRKVSAVGIITTVAGGGSAYPTDGAPATSVELGVAGVAVDGSGNLYIAGGGVVSKVSAVGIITTVAGGGTTGIGDGLPATSAQLYGPQGVAVDAGGNLYIVDTGSNSVRKVSAATGIITTVAGNYSPGYSGDGGPPTSAQVNRPLGAAADGSGNLYIADYGNNRVRLVTSGAVFSLTLNHSGSFKAGQSGDYTVTVSNAPSAGATSGTVTVTEIVPDGLTLVSMTGLGWSCGGNICTRSDPLSGGSSYAPITVTVNVASSATSLVTNQASVSGGGSIAGASDLTLISYLLTTTAFPPGSRGITANPASADGYYTGGAKVCLTANPKPGWRFSSWSGDALDGSGCLEMDSDKSVTANYYDVGRRRP